MTVDKHDPGRWNEPSGVRARGTVLVFPGRGESSAAYWRFGARLAADAYRVIVVEDDAAANSELEGAVRPVVAVGADGGVYRAVDFAARHDVDAVIVAGVPVGGETDALVAEIASRTACPAHIDVLARDGAAARAIDSVLTLGDLLAAPATLGSDIPVLAIHGAADPVSPVDAAIEVYRELGATQVTIIAGGLHDVLSDVSHRTVAATVVIFLERLRVGADLPVIARDLALEQAR